MEVVAATAIDDFIIMIIMVIINILNNYKYIINILKLQFIHSVNSTDQKPQNCKTYLLSHHMNISVMLSNITFQRLSQFLTLPLTLWIKGIFCCFIAKF